MTQLSLNTFNDSTSPSGPSVSSSLGVVEIASAEVVFPDVDDEALADDVVVPGEGNHAVNGFVVRFRVILVNVHVSKITHVTISIIGGSVIHFVWIEMWPSCNALVVERPGFMNMESMVTRG